MFGVGPEELVVIGLLVLVIFGPSKLPSIARDLGRFVNEARRSVEEFKSELLSEEEREDDRRRHRKP
ncbi:MAG TPA: twin-arginine translocase TatA/TatE family subunit [Rubrobacteraceae bacterium]|nr:twin-arginine translocase TatA/TatE family subunit [Rubrobacteraceae bacterium]